MILSAQTIRRLVKEPVTPNKPLVHPFTERTQHTTGLSYGLSGGGYDVRLDGTVQLNAHSYMLVSTMEKFCLPPSVMMRLMGKSSWIRRGVDVFAAPAEPGWSGYFTFGLINHSNSPFLIENGTPIAQCIFEVLDQATEAPYAGKYQDQPRGPVAAIL